MMYKQLFISILIFYIGLHSVWSQKENNVSMTAESDTIATLIFPEVGPFPLINIPFKSTIDTLNFYPKIFTNKKITIFGEQLKLENTSKAYRNQTSKLTLSAGYPYYTDLNFVTNISLTSSSKLRIQLDHNAQWIGPIQDKKSSRLKNESKVEYQNNLSPNFRIRTGIELWQQKNMFYGRNSEVLASLSLDSIRTWGHQIGGFFSHELGSKNQKHLQSGKITPYFFKDSYLGNEGSVSLIQSYTYNSGKNWRSTSTIKAMAFAYSDTLQSSFRGNYNFETSIFYQWEAFEFSIGGHINSVSGEISSPIKRKIQFLPLASIQWASKGTTPLYVKGLFYRPENINTSYLHMKREFWFLKPENILYTSIDAYDALLIVDVQPIPSLNISFKGGYDNRSLRHFYTPTLTDSTAFTFVYDTLKTSSIFSSVNIHWKFKKNNFSFKTEYNKVLTKAIANPYYTPLIRCTLNGDISVYKQWSTLLFLDYQSGIHTSEVEESSTTLPAILQSGVKIQYQWSDTLKFFVESSNVLNRPNYWPKNYLQQKIQIGAGLCWIF